VSENPTQQKTDAQETTAQREYQRHAATDGGALPTTEEPDVLLDVPELKVDRINLEVEGLRAHVSVLAELSNLVHLSVGVDARLDRVKLEIEGVEAQALLKVRLEHVRAILEKALDTIAENPRILENLTRTVDRTAEQVGGATREAVGESGAVNQLAGDVGDATQQVGEAAGRVTEGAQGTVDRVAGQTEQAAQGARGAASQTVSQQGQTAAGFAPGTQLLSKTIDETGRTVQRVVDDSGSIVEQTLSESGEVSEEAMVGDESAAEEAAGEAKGEVVATPAAERKAEELGVDLSRVEGTGSGGRVTVKDVQSAAQEE
jgi:hypothetical protein